MLSQLCSHQVCTLLSNSSLHTRGEAVPELEGSGKGLGWSWETGQSPRQFQSESSTLFPGVSKHVHSIYEWSLGFLQPS